MKGIPKPILIGLLVILVLFFVAVIMGGTSGTGPEDDDPSPNWTDTLADMIVRKRALGPEDIRSGCPSTFSGVCTIDIAEADARIRNLGLQLQSGAVVVTVHQRDPDTTRDLQLPDDGGDTTLELDVFRSGAEITLRCVTLGTCRVDLVPPQED